MISNSIFFKIILGLGFFTFLNTFNFTYAQDQTADELKEQINNLSPYYVIDEQSLMVLNTNGDMQLDYYSDEDESDDYSLLFNIRNDFSKEDIQLMDGEYGLHILLTNGANVKFVQNGKESSFHKNLYIFSKTSESKTAFLLDRILTFKEMLGSTSQKTSQNKGLPGRDETIAYINDIVQQTNGLSIDYGDPATVIITSGRNVDLKFTGNTHGFAQQITNNNMSVILEDFYHEIDWSKFIEIEENVNTATSASSIKLLTLLFKENSLKSKGYSNLDPSGTGYEKYYSTSGKIVLGRRVVLPYLNKSGERERLTKAILHLANLSQEQKFYDPFAN